MKRILIIEQDDRLHSFTYQMHRADIILSKCNGSVLVLKSRGCDLPTQTFATLGGALEAIGL